MLGLKSRLIALHCADQLVLSHNKTMFGRKLKKGFLFKNCILYRVFLFVIDKVVYFVDRRGS